ncbi:DUF5686 family protein [Hydrotalea sandarakina]|jgi:hypothetical protein|uniref:Carboxypeptidase-like protein n=1 Tax=Hydrotalea sandarakina TaxID=1004304 RepID=A0A2W7RMB3_9BACT|nr:DUF5686 family protein [Hydrotalea sandarakina]PZX61401.1 carboxypeptidase-like protein [Hydrotalea sandarakina]
MIWHAAKKILLSVLMLVLFNTLATAQIIKISGVIVDKQSDEPIPFSTAVFKLSGQGVLTDSSGKFSFTSGQWSHNDTLQISSVGYKNVLIPASLFKDSAFFTVKMELLPSTDVVVKSKYNRALWFWRKIMQHKPEHDRTHWKNYYYEAYNKLELDIANINTEKLSKNFLVKPLNFVFNYIDSTSEEKPFLPAYLTETISDYYHQNNPVRSREIIKATKTNGIDNESLIKQLGNMYQIVDIYANTIPVFNRSFIGPFNERADKFYNFKLLDTQYLNHRRLVHFKFTPKHKGEDLFDGDCWVNDTSFAIQKITLRPAVDVNLNFVSGLTLIQEYRLIDDSIWFLSKDKFVVDISPLGKNKLAFKGRKTTTYRKVLLNSPYVTQMLDSAKTPSEVDLLPNVTNLPDSFWVTHRHEELNKSEKTVYALLDTLEKNVTYIRYRNALEFLAKGYKDVGNFRIGPWWYWLSGNPYEGIRTRFDVETNRGFNEHWYAHTYLAYGFKDQGLKGLGEIRYQFSRQPWSYINLKYRNDLDNGQMYADEMGTDNIFATIFRRPNIPFKYQRSEEWNLEYYASTNSGFGFGTSLTSKQYQAVLNLPGKQYFPTTNGGTPLKTFEAGFSVRYAYDERTLVSNFTQYSLGSDYPIVLFNYVHGFPGVLHSSYTYDKVSLSVSDNLKIAPFGYLYYNLYGGKIFGTAPYQFLEIHPGNEQYYYNKYAFSLMNRFEYVSDEYAGVNIEHIIGNGLFRLTSFTRKLKLRQLWTFKAVVGNLSQANQQLNYVGNAPFKSLGGNVYTELGTGIDNIFKLFRVDFIWRLSPTPAVNETVNKFGVFGSFRISF